jgi:Sulfotransferase domain
MKKPHFLIIGVQRGGTSSLFRYLMKHPQIDSPVDKEIHFFDLNYQKGSDWYIQQFPFFSNYNNDKKSSSKKMITGEASPYYIFHPLVAQRVKQYCPKIKLIVLLRDPIARAISHYHHCVRFQLEKLPLNQAFKLEKDRLKGEIEKFKQDEYYYSYNHQHLAYISRGRYIKQLKHWRQYFSSEQFLILQSEIFYNNPEQTLNQVTNFLEIDNYKLTEYYPHNQAEYPKTSPIIVKQLKTYFQPYNEELYEYLEKEFLLKYQINFEL